MSFNSSVMVSGGFPKEAQVWPPIINCLFLVKECPTNVSLISAGQKLLYFDRFRSKVVFNGEDWTFTECDLNFADHIKTHNVMSEAEVMNEADRIAMNDLEQDRPLWCFHRIVNKGKGVSAVLIRVHHVIGDGIALVNAMQKILDDENGKPVTIELPGSKIKAVGSEKPLAPSIFQIMKSFFFGFLNCKTYYLVLFPLLFNFKISLIPIFIDGIFGLSSQLSTIISKYFLHWSLLFYNQHRLGHLNYIYQDAHKMHHYLHGSTAFDAHIYGSGMPEEWGILMMEIIGFYKFGIIPSSLSSNVFIQSWYN